MQIKNYDILEELYGADRATRKHARTSKQRMKQWEKETIDLNYCSENVEIHDPNVSMNDEQQFSPPNLDAFSPQYAPSNQSIDTSTSRGIKRKRNIAEIMEAQYERMHVGIMFVAEALKDGNSLSNKLHNAAKRQVAIAEKEVGIAEK
ncbi:unnamed protein product [Lupinus luteus]|uniref:Uncharacterized protein n=1 Tax=Lupinus luteus TaxID=3873 RepID=A0AAV1WJG5_LUPLU